MKTTKTIIFIFFAIIVSYGLVLFGFIQGFQYAQSFNDMEASDDAKVLSMLRSNQLEKAINNMEERLNSHIVSYQQANKIFQYLYPPLVNSREEHTKRYFKNVKKYRDSSGYSCNEPEEVCAYVQNQLNKN